MAARSTYFTAGNRVGPYEILDQLSQDDTGTTYKTYQASLHRHVAIKILADQYASDLVVAVRFLREAPSVIALHHLNLPQVYEVGEVDGSLYMLMEYVEGESLQNYLQGTPLTLSNCVSLVDQLADVLAYLHRQGIVHGDVTPANILIAKTKDRLVLLGFGLATLLETPISKSTTTTIGGTGPTAYMSPEVVLGQPAGAQSDQYALAVLTFEMLSGRRPFRTITPNDLEAGPTTKDLPSLLPLNQLVTPDLQAAVQQALSKKPAARYNTIAAFNTAFQAAVKANINWPGLRTTPPSLFPNRTNAPTQAVPPTTQGKAHKAATPASAKKAKTVRKKRTLTQFEWLLILIVGASGCVVIVTLLLDLVFQPSPKPSVSSAQAVSRNSLPVITAAPTPTPLTIAPSFQTDIFTYGGFPIKDDFHPLLLSDSDKQALVTFFGNFADPANISFYTTATDATSIFQAYKLYSWQDFYQANQLPTSPMLFSKNGEEALLMVNALTGSYIKSLPITEQALLSPGQNLVVLADNIDDKNPGLQKFFDRQAIASFSTTTALNAQPAPAAPTPALTYEPYTDIWGGWQAQMPANWRLRSSGSKDLLNTTFTSQHLSVSLDVSILNETSLVPGEDFYDGFKDDSALQNVVDFTRQKKVIQGYPAVLVQGTFKNANAQMAFQSIYINLGQTILEIYPGTVYVQNAADLSGEAELTEVVKELLATLKITNSSATFPASPTHAAAISDLHFASYLSPYGKWTASIPADWEFKNEINNDNMEESWLVTPGFELNVEQHTVDVGKIPAATLQSVAEEQSKNYALQDPKTESRFVDGQPALLLTGKKAGNNVADQAYHDYACIILFSPHQNTLYTVTIQVDMADGEPLYQPVLDSMLASFHIIP